MPTMRSPHHWSPEDRESGAAAGQAMAQRNLWLTIPALMLACAVWMLWSAVVVHLPAAGFRFSTPQRFWLTALPALSGATLCLATAFAWPLIGGRRFTALATASLLLPTVGVGLAVQDPNTPFEWMVVLALLCGLGGGHFAAAMVNISGLFAQAHPRRALSLNTGLGHLGVALVQWVVPLSIGVGVFGIWGGTAQATPNGAMWLQNAGFVWVPLIVASTAAAWFGMHDVAELTPLRAGLGAQAVIFTRRHTWWMCWLSLGTFGSLIGFAASVPLWLPVEFELSQAQHLVWMGPLIGAMLIPLGGWMADRWTSARVSFWMFVAMAGAATLALLCLPPADSGAGAVAQGAHLAGFLAALALIFAAAGAGSGSTLRMISSLFVAERMRRADPLPNVQAQAAREGAAEAVAALGFASAIGAYGGFFIPKSIGASLAMTGSAASALQFFILFYLSCMALTWWTCGRRHAPCPC